MPNAKKRLSEQVIVITGASSGIGLTTARMAAQRGARVVLVARSTDDLVRETERIEREGGRAVHVVADVQSRDSLEAVAERALDAFGDLDTWVNVAGATIYGKLWEVEAADSERLMQTNFWGTVNGSLVAVEHLRGKGGTIINVGSVASDVALPLQGMYSASKHAVKGFTDALRMELRQDSIPIAVTLIKPASIDTPIAQRARNYMDREPRLPPPLYRPEEVAEAILHAAVHPRRDIYVGGASKMLSDLNSVAPGLYDRLAPVIVASERRTGQPRNPTGALHDHQQAGAQRSGKASFVMPVSLYTRASLALPTPARVVAGLSAAVDALRDRRNRDRNGR